MSYLNLLQLVDPIRCERQRLPALRSVPLLLRFHGLRHLRHRGPHRQLLNGTQQSSGCQQGSPISADPSLPPQVQGRPS